ncbi:ATP-dependent DNA helicase [Limnochorda pilosa]|uniref:Helicase n=1 Tax=Limnochorda pilosa TaxID=1555112 RepID=A0A0K2SNJ3_LIMPI|nr:helicase C-terminal domain-containing protein [Limnochorda pilosa]BAS28409.1 helicase [Limnochorda pilosa]
MGWVREAEDFFRADGPLARALPQYEWRPQQARMARQVALVLEGSAGPPAAVALIEAGTGTGKSLAYLVPALFYAHATGERVVVSTQTIPLQEQLVSKDLPSLQEVLPFSFTHALVKGWANYLCLLRLERIRSRPEEQDEETEDELQALAAWADEVDEGSRSELPFEPTAELWEEVSADPDACLRADCPLFQRCHFFQARRKMEGAQLLVVNHHLLLADAVVRQAVGWESDRAVLPVYGCVILDEAHHLEETASAHLGRQLTRRGVERLLHRLHRSRGNRGGLLATARLLAGEAADREAKELLELLDWQILPATRRAGEQAEALFDGLAAWAARADGLRVIRPGELPERLERLAREAAGDWTALAGLLDRFRADLKGFAPAREERGRAVLAELEGVDLALRRQAEDLEAILQAEGPDEVHWLEGGRAGVKLRSAPVEVGPLLQRALFDQLAGVVATSATLTVDGRFDYLVERLGLEECRQDGRLLEEVIESPFDYAAQALLAVAEDLPEPGVPGFADAVAETLELLVPAVSGGTLVLFTSYQMLEEAGRALEGRLPADRGLMRQGDLPRSQLLDRLRSEPGAVCLATASFWEGVDLPGQALELVVIARLPFAVPTEPVVAARIERLRRLGRDAFAAYQLPEMVLRLKQGFGRLIRHRTDRGAVVVLDGRVTRRRYGQTVLASLPPASLVRGGRQAISEAVRRWLAEGPREVAG